MAWAAQLIERQFDQYYNLRGEAATVQRWLSRLPVDLLESRPRLLLAQALLAARGGDVAAVEPLLDAAERASGDAVDEPYEPTIGRAASMLVNVGALIANFRAYIAELRNDADGTSAFAAKALAELNEGERLVDSMSRWNRAAADWLCGRLAEAERVFVPQRRRKAGRRPADVECLGKL